MTYRRILLVTIALTLAVVPSRPGWALTLSQLETETRTLLRDTAADTNFQRFSQSQIDAYLNEAQRDFQNTSWLLQGSTQFLLVPGQRAYPVPYDFAAAISVKVSSTPIGEITVRGFNQDDPLFETAVGTPTVFFIDNYSNGVAPSAKFYPNPTTALPITLYYVQQARTLVNASDVPFDSDPHLVTYHDALADFAAAKCWLLLGRADLSGALMGMYSSRATMARADVFKMPNSGPTGAK